MKRINWPLMMGVGYITSMITLAGSTVGNVIKEEATVDYSFPFLLGVLIILPFIFGWLAHKEHSS